MFVVDTTPYCMWGWRLKEDNLRFLDGIDPAYFKHVVEVHSGALESDNKQFAALSIRLAYSQALETFFALLCSALQAPTCPLGWMLKYRPFELFKVVRKIQSGAPLLLAKLSTPVTWESLSREINGFNLDDASEDRRIKELFESFWDDFARDFVDSTASAEYNSIKHGLRARPGGQSLTIAGIESKSVYGSRFFRAESLTDDDVNFHAPEAGRNWNPVALAVRVEVLAVSISNVVSYLKIAGGTPQKSVPFLWPEAQPALSLAWKEDYEGGFFLRSFQGGYKTLVSDIEPKTKQEILAAFKRGGS